jgi:DNA polymerase-3 subunit alpha
LESLAYAGTFDCFPEHHRAQFFYTSPEDPITGLEKIIRFGQIYQQNNMSSANTLFGDLPLAIEIKTPNLPACDPWPLVVQLDHEKEVTGMFLSGHPLDHYRFELKHYGITSLAEFNEVKEAVNLYPNSGRLFRLIGLVTSAEHKISRKGNKYGSFAIEDYSGKTDLVVWGDDYVRFTPFLQQGASLFIYGFFKQRFNTPEYEFKINAITTVETIKKNLTKQLTIETQPKNISGAIVSFIEENVRAHPGRTMLRFMINEPKENLKISLVTMDNGFEMNDELVEFLDNNPELDVQVVSN